MENNMDKMINELEDEALGAVAGGIAGRGDWESFESIIMTAKRNEELEQLLAKISDFLSNKIKISHYEMYRLDDIRYKYVITPVVYVNEFVYDSFRELILLMEGAELLDMRIL